MSLGIHRTKLLHHGLLKELANCSRLLLVHGRLVGQTNLVHHGIWVKTFRNSIFEILQKGLLVAAIKDVVHHHFRLLHILDTNVIFAETDSRNCLLVFVLSVNDRRESLLLVLVDHVPDLGYPRAGRVDDFNILLVKVGHFLNRRTKGGQDDDIPVLDRLEILLALAQLFNKLDIHGRQVVVDFGVVNQLVGDVDPAVGEVIDRLVGESNASFDAPAKAKVLENT